MFRVLGLDSGGGTLNDPILSIYDQNGNWLDYSDDFFGYDPFTGLVAGYDGDYYLAVDGYGDPGTYTVQVKQGQPQIDDHLNDLTTSSRLILDNPMIGELEYFDYTDMFVVTLEEG